MGLLPGGGEWRGERGGGLESSKLHLSVQYGTDLNGWTYVCLVEDLVADSLAACCLCGWSCSGEGGGACMN